MPYNLNANPILCECPCCNLQTNGEEQIENSFGWRTMKNGDTIPQSYCREYRSAHCKAGKPCKTK